MKLSVVALLLSASMSSGIAAAQTTVTTQTTNTGTPSQPTQDAAASLRRKTEATLQQMAQQQADKASCPVELTSANFAPYAMLVAPGSPNHSPRPVLDLGLRNRSGKSIASAQLVFRLRVKRSVYDMQSYPLDVPVTIQGVKIADDKLEQLEHLFLPGDLHPVSILGATLSSVTYTDGTSWTPTLTQTSAQACSLQPNGMQQIAAK
ncbi:hypothetical protein [Silvibacterium sp.]|uniref:hypothetical protein n=1 Tax=Silvibacterium sp. TaxID=1964179 RepID=UPI0039E5FB70